MSITQMLTIQVSHEDYVRIITLIDAEIIQYQKWIDDANPNTHFYKDALKYLTQLKTKISINKQSNELNSLLTGEEFLARYQAQTDREKILFKHIAQMQDNHADILEEKDDSIADYKDQVHELELERCELEGKIYELKEKITRLERQAC